MAAIFSTKWTNKHGDEPTQEWANLILRMNPKRVALAIKNTGTFAPDIKDFIEASKPTYNNIGAPPLFSAYHEYCNNGKDILSDNKVTVGKEWSHKAIYYAKQQLGDVSHLVEKDIKQEFFGAYEDIIGRMFDGEEFPDLEPVLFVQNQTKERVQTELGAATLKSLKKDLGI